MSSEGAKEARIGLFTLPDPFASFPLLQHHTLTTGEHLPWRKRDLQFADHVLQVNFDLYKFLRYSCVAHSL